MIYLRVFAILVVVMSSTILCKQGYTKVYETTVTRAVGPTTETGQRGTLPVASPSDANSIWLAPNGSDANPGTQASPKLTLEGAVTALGAITNIQIFRNGTVGPIQIDSGTPGVGDYVILDSGETLQVEEGEIAEIVFETYGFRLNGDNTLNGAIITLAPGAVFSTVDGSLNLNGSGIAIDNCYFRPYDSDLALFEYIYQTAAGVTFSHSVIQAPRGSNTGLGVSSIGFVTLLANSSNSMTNTIIYMDGAPNYAAAFNFVPLVFLSGSTSTPTFDRMLVDGGAVQFASSSGSTVEINSSVLQNASYGLFRATTPNSSTNTFTYNLTNCKRSEDDYYDNNPGGAGTLTVNLTETSPLNTSVPNLFVDEEDGFADENWGAFRLQAEGKDVPNGSGQYFLDSPLIDAGVSGVDAAPWDEDTVLVSEGFTDELNLDADPSTHTVLSQFVNPVEIDNIRGGIATDFDAERLVWAFQWPGPPRWAGNRTWKQIRALRRDKGVKAVYLRGEDGNLLSDFNDGSDFTGTFDSSDNSIVLDTGVVTNEQLIDGNWRSFWMEIVDGSNVFDYLITESTDDGTYYRFYLEDKLGNGFPSDGTYSVAVRYFLAMVQLGDHPLVQPGTRRGFTQGSKWAEDDPTESPAERAEANPPGGYSLTLVTTEDLRTA